MMRLRLHTCVFPASLSNAHHWSEHRGLGGALSFRSHDFVHFALLGQIRHLHTRHRRQCIHPSDLVLVDGPCELAAGP